MYYLTFCNNFFRKSKTRNANRREARLYVSFSAYAGEFCTLGSRLINGASAMVGGLTESWHESPSPTTAVAQSKKYRPNLWNSTVCADVILFCVNSVTK